MPTTTEIIDRAKKVLVGNYKQQPIAIERGEGCYVWDYDGKKYLDLLGGIATCALGHCHPEVMRALAEQSEKLWHVSNVFYTLPQIELAEKLTRLSGLDRAFFCNSGAEANEALIKLARKVQKDRGQNDRVEIVTFENSFHGRTLATIAATGQPKYQKGFEPMPQGFVHVPYGDLDEVKKVVGAKTAAILVEPIQGEGGVRMAPAGFLAGLRKVCDDHGLLLMIDEVQTGMGRTGKMFGFQHDGVAPDAISIAKAVGNGIPIGGMLCREQVSLALGPGTHGSTFGGNLLAAAAANVTTSLISEPQMLESIQQKGHYLLEKGRALAQKHPGKISALRGRGLLFGVELPKDAAPTVAKCRDAGLLVNLAGERTIRFAPPLNVSQAQLDDGLAILEQALTQ